MHLTWLSGVTREYIKTWVDAHIAQESFVIFLSSVDTHGFGRNCLCAVTRQTPAVDANHAAAVHRAFDASEK